MTLPACAYGTRTTDSLAFTAMTGTPDLLILDGRNPATFPALAKSDIKVIPNGRVIAYIVTLDTVEHAKTILEDAGLKQCRLVSTDGNPNSPTPLLEEAARTLVVLAVKHNNPQYNDRYHLGVLNDQPNTPRTTAPEQGGVERTTVHLETPEAMLAYTLGELVSLHTEPGQVVAIDTALVEPQTTLSFLWRTRPPKPAPSAQAQANKAQRAIDKAQKASL